MRGPGDLVIALHRLRARQRGCNYCSGKQAQSTAPRSGPGLGFGQVGDCCGPLQGDGSVDSTWGSSLRCPAGLPTAGAGCPLLHPGYCWGKVKRRPHRLCWEDCLPGQSCARARRLGSMCAFMRMSVCMCDSMCARALMALWSVHVTLVIARVLGAFR